MHQHRLDSNTQLRQLITVRLELCLLRHRLAPQVCLAQVQAANQDACIGMETMAILTWVLCSPLWHPDSQPAPELHKPLGQGYAVGGTVQVQQ